MDDANGMPGCIVYLKQVELENFKSFGGKLTVPFMEGYTAVTGPNGSGMLYTAVTRGRKLVCIVGSSKAEYIAVRNNEVRERHTTLADRLRAGEADGKQPDS